MPCLNSNFVSSPYKLLSKNRIEFQKKKEWVQNNKEDIITRIGNEKKKMMMTMKKTKSKVG